MLLSGEEIGQVCLMTPRGIELCLDVEDPVRMPDRAECSIRKYSGDDPDVTDGLLIRASVEKTERKDIVLEGGPGVGRVTRPGLEQNIGEAAINRVPRQMILTAVQEICSRYGYEGGIQVTILVPEGEKIAEKTFNPRLGIEGGISILGTSGIVEPMSEKALTDTIYLEMKMLRKGGSDYLCVVPGNYGTDFLREVCHFDTGLAVKCSNYIGETIEFGKILGFKGILLIGHAGKFIKLAAGVMNTHSRQADCRMEVLTAHAALAGADRILAEKIMACINTTEALELLRSAGILDQVMKTVMKKTDMHLSFRAGKDMEIGAVMFSGNRILGMTERAQSLYEKIKAEQSGRGETGG